MPADTAGADSRAEAQTGRSALRVLRLRPASWMSADATERGSAALQVRKMLVCCDQRFNEVVHERRAAGAVDDAVVARDRDCHDWPDADAAWNRHNTIGHGSDG